MLLNEEEFKEQYQVTIKNNVRFQVLITLMMEAARTFETSADIQLRTRQYIPEDSDNRK
jgi:hypothetical protein